MKKFLTFLLTAFFAASIFAQDFDDFDDFGDASGGSSSSPVSVSGDATMEADFYLDDDAKNEQKYEVDVLPQFKLAVDYLGASTQVGGVFKFNRDAIPDNLWDMLDEFTIRADFGNFALEGGKMRVVWGKGDKVHVLDNFNANDFTHFIIPDYLDRRIAEPMFRLSYNAPVANLHLETIYAPTMTADRFAQKGAWQPASVTGLTEQTMNLLFAKSDGLLSSPTAGTTAQLYELLSTGADLFPKTRAIEYGQAGLRFTGSAGILDWGVSYYYGRDKQPSANIGGIVEAGIVAQNPAFAVAFPNAGRSPSLSYEQIHVFGLELAAAVWRFNLRGEAGYFLTEDIAGDDPWAHNNSVQWVAGFDIDLPIHNINLNIQNQGKAILNHGEIGEYDGELPAIFSPYRAQVCKAFKNCDLDWNDGKATNNKLIFYLTDNFLHEKLKVECKVLWGIERGDYMLMPGIRWNVKDGLDIYATGFYLGGESDSEWAEWRNNGFLKVGMQYKF